MKHILGGIFLSVLFFGCRQAQEPPRAAIALCCAVSEGSKAEALAAGEEVAVFACAEGTEDYFLEAAKFIVDADERSLNYGSAVYYPDPKEAVRFLAYFPFGGTWDKGRGTFSVPTDQSKPEALKEADLCGATASSTPVATPVALEFRHLMARLVITTKEPTTKITFPNVVASGVVHAATAELVLGTVREDIWTESTTSKELIVPAQPLSRLVLTVADTVLGVISKVEYVFEGSVSLEAGKTTTLDLTLHPDTKTATLSGSSVTDWELVKTEGSPSHAVSNTLTLHWPNYLLQGATPDRIIFTIGGTDYAVSNGITYANHTFTVPFISSELRYPYTISKIAFYRGATPALPSCADLLGSVIYKSGALTVGIKDFVCNSVLIDDLWWATGNLIAVSEENNHECKIGDPADGGLYFQFGSLIGYKGGNQDNGGTGVGVPKGSLASANGNYWNGVGFSWASDAMVWPTAMTETPAAWPANNGSAAGDRNTVVNQWFFNYNTAPYSTAGQDIRRFSIPFEGDTGKDSLATGRYAVWGIGDPCTYYLGGTWRIPTTEEQTSLAGKTGMTWVAWTTAGVMGRWATASDTFIGVSGPGAWFGTGLQEGMGIPTATNLFFPVTGFRGASNGAFYNVMVSGYVWSCSVGNAIFGYGTGVNGVGVLPQDRDSRSNGLPVRCVCE